MDDKAFSWGQAKSAACAAERGFEFAYAVRLFEGPVLERIDARFDYGETRIQAIGHIEGLLYVVIYTQRRATKHIVSARRAHEREWERWPK